MTPVERVGATGLAGDGWSARVLRGAPLIAPARHFTFPFAVAGEEDALARGALWLEVRVGVSGAGVAGSGGAGLWVAQCALGFAGGGVAHGLWPLPQGGVLACAGGYAYAVDPEAPERTVLLPPRPAVGVIAMRNRTILVTHQGLTVRERDAETWTTPRLSWEGVNVTAAEEDAIQGTGWNMIDDAELPFTVDLRHRAVTGGGYLEGGPAVSSDRR